MCAKFKDKLPVCYNPYKQVIRLEHLNVDVLVHCPCGKCINCLRKYEREWSMRMREEQASSKSSFFVTLTYDDSHVPVGDNCYLLCKNDYQLFLKRLRKRLFQLDGIKLRYVICGEYGGITNRPHYHLALFLDKKVLFHLIYSLIQDCWKCGFIQVDYLRKERIKYLCKYFNKLDDRFHDVRTFRHMSLGIGKSFLTPAVVAYYRKTLNTIVHRFGSSYGMPRYYKNKIFNDYDKEILLLRCESDFNAWLSDFVRIHGNVDPFEHYRDKNFQALEKAKIKKRSVLNDDII